MQLAGPATHAMSSGRYRLIGGIAAVCMAAIAVLAVLAIVAQLSPIQHILPGGACTRCPI